MSLARLKDVLRIPRRVESQAPLAAALRDHYRTGRAVDLTTVRSEGFEYAISSREFFEVAGPLERLELTALRAARGRVLDVGAGAGRHALWLQARGHDVVAIDVEAANVELMRQRGVVDARCADVFQLTDVVPRCDTILFLMQSIGIAGTLYGLERLLASLRDRLEPHGQILLDSSALQENVTSPAGPIAESDSSGEVEAFFEYRNLRGEPFPWLYVSWPDLRDVADGLGWRATLLHDPEPTGEYLAELVPLVRGGIL